MQIFNANEWVQAPPCHRLLAAGDRRQQLLCVGMLRIVKDSFGLAAFDHLAFFHDHDLIRDIRDDCQVMANKQYTDVALGL